jgi:hypothetical protein
MTRTEVQSLMAVVSVVPLLGLRIAGQPGACDKNNGSELGAVWMPAGRAARR